MSKASTSKQSTLTAFIKKRPAEDPAEGSDAAASKRTATSAADDQDAVEKRGVHKLGDNFKLEKETMGNTWFNALRPEFDKPYFAKLKTYLANEYKTQTIYPVEADVYSWSRYCSLPDVKVVIVGQDPYINENQAHGLCFSVSMKAAIPPSLRNMYTELASDIPGFKPPKHGNLESWSKQGVLLLNAVLTVRAGASNSHAGQGWEEFTKEVLSTVSRRRTNVVFILWGNYAKKLGKLIDKSKHTVLEGAHPSPLSVKLFTGCKHFSKCNDALEASGQQPINWNSVNEAPAS
ncbi:uracil-DNA glycosylase [Capsaspora owczarzaki ATCC 30864]|uniref:Uracil-DNA glycosylase n=1 Tax=Capsaspora owczarzaki (strain ATCC 30864) TaxID=595528 RepID=A0A0D2U4S9_CAPO3|nr:uracil-DNA glycosylase [Capsaspora owczarzaki ATCC 30864]KJE90136.1 uracil-DNA glycosylase [Capsaspora owczarzaki ATCC 30864]|eukprot:XP_004364353.1 uracil-DNA glycosylase [Capsaspora owczarzaki ATCC 30864]